VKILLSEEFMVTPELSPLDEANDTEVDLYYEVEETMYKAGELKITKEELYEDIDAHESIYFLKNHDHFHYFTILVSIALGWLAYMNYSETNLISRPTVALGIASLAMILLSWLITHPRLKYEKQARDYFRTHRRLFMYKD
jgi:hypothetical protein